MKNYLPLSYLQFSWLLLLILNFGCSKYNEPAFGIDKKVHFYVINGEAVVSSFGHEEEVVVPAEVEIDGQTYTVTTIGGLACNKDVKKLHLPPTIKKISQSAFETNEIEELYIEDLAAWCATDIETDFDSGNTFFMYNTKGSPFNKNTKLFVDNEPVEDVLTIPDGVKKINDFVFQNFNCKKIVIGHDVQTIGIGAFNREDVSGDIPSVSSIEEIDLGYGVVEISQQAFSGCKNLKVLRLSDKLENVGTWAFEYCNPTQIYCPSLSTWFGIEYDWRNVNQTIDGPQLSEEYDLYIGGEKITDIEVPSGVVLSDLCFAGANIERAVFEEGVTSTGGWPFLNCRKLETMVLPSTLESCALSFLNCDSLKEVWAWCDVPEELYGSYWLMVPGESACPQATLYVPEEYLESYKAAEGWNTFKEILPIPDSGVGEIVNR